MLRKRILKVVKWVFITFASLFIIVFCFGLWFKGLIPPKDVTIENSQAKDLPYLSQNIQPYKGKILAMVTSTDIMGNSEKSTGYELTELARAYYVFKANGFEVDIASPLGGRPPVVIDDEDMGAYDFAFLNDTVAQSKTNNTIPIKDVVAGNYEAIFFAGGKGAMFDFPENRSIQSIIRNMYESNKVIGAVCHGPAALVNVRLGNGDMLLQNKTISGFTNEEELLLIPDAATIFPFLLQDKLTEQGAHFSKGAMYLEKISHDKNIITGQNPWSTWALAEAMVKQLGYTPKQREVTAEENAVRVLNVYEAEGKQKAKEMIYQMSAVENKPLGRILIAKHSIIAMMKGELGRFVNLVGLTAYAKKISKSK